MDEQFTHFHLYLFIYQSLMFLANNIMLLTNILQQNLYKWIFILSGISFPKI